MRLGRQHLSKKEILLVASVTSLCWLCMNAVLIYSANLPPGVRTAHNNHQEEYLKKRDVQDGGGGGDDVIPRLLHSERRVQRKGDGQQPIMKEKENKRKPMGADHQTAQQENAQLRNVHAHKLRVKEAKNKDNQERKILNPKPVVPMYEKLHRVDIRTLPRSPQNRGELGEPVRTQPSEKSKVDQGWKAASFNEFVSDQISLERSLRDVRHKDCDIVTYPYNVLPKTSIIICFTEESWSTLLRSVHSIFNRSPPQLLEEVILVDDFSQRAHLKEPLEKYLTEHFGDKVKLLRMLKRQGLIRSRMMGVAAAKGPVITFLDSHIECTLGWLEPLLGRIWENKATVVSPVIDPIDSKTFAYTGAPSTVRGGFDWSMQFRWVPVPQHEKKRRQFPTTDPIRTPTMAGGLFAVDKLFFNRLGQYDSGLEIWGAENLELSFKTWMCHGQLEIVPCSHVGHVFRATQPYTFPDGNTNTFLRNSQRVAEVWMDEYKEHFYENRPNRLGAEYGDISRQVERRRQMGCHSFKWYLENVYPELAVPHDNVHAKGAVHHLGTNLCLDNMSGHSIALFNCQHGVNANQVFRYSWKGELMAGMKCIGRSFGLLIAMDCTSKNVIIWSHYRGGRLYDPGNDSCLQLVPTTQTELELGECSARDKNQKWKFDTYYTRGGKALV